MDTNAQDDEAPTPITKRIRPEGVALQYDNLSPSQQESFHRILYVLQEATELAGQKAMQSRRFRPNNVIFISGTRGTGKTCLLHSIIRYTDDSLSSQTDRHLETFFQEGSDQKRRKRAMDTVRRSVEWLPSIDVDPLPADFDLITSVLVRIRNLIRKREQQESPRSAYQNSLRHDPYQRDLGLEAKYEQLLVDAARGWKGGLLGADESREAELFADACEELARANLGFAERFRSYLNQVCEEYFSEKTIFVLPIDDTDLKPPRGLEVLKLLRMLHAPRLFVIAMGDIELFELVSSLQMMKEMGFTQQMTESSLLPVKSDTVRRHVSTITATALRKLIPLDQRFFLDNYRFADAFGFQPEGTDIALGNILKALPIVINDHMRSERFDGASDDESKFPKRRMPYEMSLMDLLLINRAPDPRQPDEVKSQISASDDSNSTLSSASAHDLPATGAMGAFLQLLPTDEAHCSETRPSKEEEDRAIGYFGRRCLQTSARRIADIWFSLHRLYRLAIRMGRKATAYRQFPDLGMNNESGSDQDDKLNNRMAIRGRIESYYEWFWDVLLDTLQKICRQSLMEETVLEVDQRDRIDRAFDEHADSVDWTDMPLTLRPMYEHGRSMIRRSRSELTQRLLPGVFDELKDKQNQSHDGIADRPLPLTVGTTVRYYINPPKLWTVETATSAQVRKDVRKAMKGRKNYFDSFDHRPVSTDTAAILSLYHDLLQFSPRGESFYPHFVDMTVYEGLPWASTSFETGPRNRCVFYWPAPPCVSVVGLDFFAHLWKKATDESAGSKTHICAERSALLWISFGTSVVASLRVPDDQLDDFTVDVCPDFQAGHEYSEIQSKYKARLDKQIQEVFKATSKPKLKKLLDDAATKGETLQRALLARLVQVGYELNQNAQNPKKLDASGFLQLAVKTLGGRSWVKVLASGSKSAAETDGSENGHLFLQRVIRDAKIRELAIKVRRDLSELAGIAVMLRTEKPEADVSQNHRDWLVDVVAMLMPELGISGTLRREILFAVDFGEAAKDSLIEFMCNNRRAIRAKRAWRLAKLVWQGQPHLAVRLAYADPNLYGTHVRLSKSGFFRAFHFLHPRHDELRSGLVWFYDDPRVLHEIKMTLGKREVEPSAWELQQAWLEQASGPDVKECLERAVITAAESMTVWDSSRSKNHNSDHRRSSLKRLYRLQQADADSEDFSHVEEEFDIWQHGGRFLTPSIEEIEWAGESIYGDEWQSVSLRNSGYHLDFSGQTYFPGR